MSSGKAIGSNADQTEHGWTSEAVFTKGIRLFFAVLSISSKSMLIISTNIYIVIDNNMLTTYCDKSYLYYDDDITYSTWAVIHLNQLMIDSKSEGVSKTNLSLLMYDYLHLSLTWQFFLGLLTKIFRTSMQIYTILKKKSASNKIERT